MSIKLFLTFVLILTGFAMHAQINNSAEIVVLQIDENKTFPNNSKLPVLLYKNVFQFEELNPAGIIENVFAKNNWGGSWRNGIYNFQHYHSTAHEALGVYSGWAEVQVGGPGNQLVRIEKGDLVVLPAGIAHKRMDSGDSFAVVGSYPDGQNWDMNYGKVNEFDKSKANIIKVSLPQNDPVYGKNGKIFKFWK